MISCSARIVPILAVAVIAMGARPLAACSICTSVSPTICDEIGSAQIAVIARYESAPKNIDPRVADPEAYKATFRIERILKGATDLGEVRSARVLFFGGKSVKQGDLYLVHGNLIENDERSGMEVKWTTPISVDTRSIRYINKMLELPKEGTERLVYAMDFLTDSQEMLRRDAFDEFAKAPYATLEKLKPQLNPDVFVKRIVNKETPSTMRKLYFTLLSICGRPSDLPMLAAMIHNYEPKQNTRLAAMIACYLSLSGAEGLPLVEKTYLMSEDPNLSVAAGAAVTALRFHGEEANVIDREKIVSVMRRMLERPQLAAKVLSDLARWEDWTVVDKVAQLFADAEGDSLWVREPAVRYLLVCPLPEAKAHLARLDKIDPAAIPRARRFMAIETKQNTRAADAAETTEASKTEASKTEASKEAEQVASDSGETVAVASIDLAPESKSTAKMWFHTWLIYLPVAAGLLFVVLLLVGVKRRNGES